MSNHWGTPVETYTFQFQGQMAIVGLYVDGNQLPDIGWFEASGRGDVHCEVCGNGVGGPERFIPFTMDPDNGVAWCVPCLMNSTDITNACTTMAEDGDFDE